MSVARREAEIVWEGSLARGAGVLTSGSGALDKLAVTWASSRTERAPGKTSPEELLASAHASCFAMALALVLDEYKTLPQRLGVSATCTLDEVEGAPRVTTVELSIRAQVPGLDAAAFERMVGLAAELCPVSNALRGNVKINVRSELVPTVASTTPRAWGERASRPLYVAVAPQPAGGRSRGHRARSSTLRSADSRATPGRLRGSSLVLSGGQASPGARRRQRTDQITWR
jgi:osmotically inducible protein OsmC